ncbi:hypothetical protein PV08_03100 [Exophiala spinifera]|uniref:Zn(2)-C6 fungal-type domain-containing protein n=1 Tax=Exophiala spinifera TaxID=91928 RepID=A0A0D1YU72_9EURO|nr:uncharacterized protein PV08_03100 [Exophiala spinifera]KIW18811.1 hypothetical protein PV08_03100 [Exophiala spinifera]
MAQQDAQPTTQAPFCPVCGTIYSRIDHLRRHLAAHTDDFPHSCQLCNKRFKRRDVLKRHYQACSASQIAIDSWPGSDEKPKMTRKACDQCFKLKRACNSARPCQTCALRRSICTYSRLNRQPLETSVSPTQPDADTAEMLCAATQTTTMGLQKGTDVSVEEVKTVAPSHIWQMHLRHRPSSEFGPTTDVFGDESRSPVLECSTDASDPERDPAESFDFLVRHVNNESGLRGAFGVDSSLVEEDTSCVEVTQGFSSVMSSHAIEESPRTLFERHSANARRYSRRQVNLDPSDKQQTPRLIKDPFDGDWRTRSSVFMSPAFDFSTSNSNSLGASQRSPIQKLADSKCILSADTMHSTLALKSHEVVVALKATVNLRGSDVKSALGDWSALKESACWALWHPNWPAIHKPSFTAATSPCELVAPMALIGASLSPHSSDREDARVWFDVVEEMVFCNIETMDSSTSIIATTSTTQSCRPGQLEVWVHSLQAAYAVCLYQNWEGRDAAKERIRKRRFSSLISMTRILMKHANHRALRELLEHGQLFRWEKFVLHEQLIRVIIYVFLLDTAFTIFNNVPPRMVIREMTNDLACPEPCFQASTAEECGDEFQKWTTHPIHSHCGGGGSLYASIRRFRQDRIELSGQRCLADIGVLNLWTIVSSFHNFIFHIDPGFGSESQIAAMENAIANWRVVWNLRRAHCSRGPTDLGRSPCSGLSSSVCDPNQVWKRIGFMREAPEYWLLARVKLERLSSTQRSLEAAEGLSGFNSRLCNMPGNILPKYDETSMEQLSEFIDSFAAMKVKDDDRESETESLGDPSTGILPSPGAPQPDRWVFLS